MSKKNKNKYKLPKEIIPIQNLDKKGWHEKWTKSRDMLDIPHPYRILIAGKPNCGKSTLAKNILLRASKPFQKIIIVHCDSEGTKEYDDLKIENKDEEDEEEKVIIIGNVPSPKNNKLFDPKIKTLLIFDDLEYEFLDKIQRKNLDRIFGYLSTHKNVSIIMCAQNITNIPPAVRRMSNFFIIFRVPDMDLLYLIARKTGINRDVFNEIFQKYIKGHHDSFWIDITLDTPYPYRINGYQKLEINN